MTRSRMPALFLGHGNPMNALADNAWTQAWRGLGESLPRPRGVVCISAHWYGPGLWVTLGEQPRTLHDFGGFPPALYEVQYPAPGSQELAARVCKALAPAAVEPDGRWGLDHGAWSLLVHLYPRADVPVVQLSLDERRSGLEHFALARALAPLRDEGILILGSGNVVHNLHAYAWGRHDVAAYDWALRFERKLREDVIARRFQDVADYEHLGPDGALSAPTPEHYLPLLYVLAQCGDGDEVTFPVEGFDGGSVSMLGMQVG